MTKTIKVLLIILIVIILLDCGLACIVNREAIAELGNGLVLGIKNRISIPSISKPLNEYGESNQETVDALPTARPLETVTPQSVITEKPILTTPVPTPFATPQQMPSETNPVTDTSSKPSSAEIATTINTEEFFSYCETGELWTAAKWLLEHEEEFPDREMWENAIMLYLPFCGTWKVYYGDSTIVPTSAGTQIRIEKMKANARITREEAVLHLSDVDENLFAIELFAPFGELPFFVETEMEIWQGKGVNTYDYTATITETGRLNYTRFIEGKPTHNCEFVRIG